MLQRNIANPDENVNVNSAKFRKKVAKSPQSDIPKENPAKTTAVLSKFSGKKVVNFGKSDGNQQKIHSFRRSYRQQFCSWAN